MAGTGARFGGLCGQAISQAGLQSRRTTQTRSRFAIRASSPSDKSKDGPLARLDQCPLVFQNSFPPAASPSGTDRPPAAGERIQPLMTETVLPQWRSGRGGGNRCPVRRSVRSDDLASELAESPDHTDPESLRAPRLLSFCQAERRGHCPGWINVH